MKKQIALFFILFNFTLYSQTPKMIEKELNDLLQKREEIDSQAENSYDLLAKYNKELQNLVLKFTSSNPETLTYKFENLRNGLNIVSSEDGQFRIYTWNTLQGGSMQYYKNVFQFKAGGKIHSKLSDSSLDNKNSGVNFLEVNELKVDDKTYYLTTSVAVGSSALYYYQAKVFAIEKGKLNENAKLIKTKTGIKNTLGYEVDLSSTANRDRKDGLESSDFSAIIYDKKNKIIIIPLINENGMVTKNKIKYKFEKLYFKKM